MGDIWVYEVNGLAPRTLCMWAVVDGNRAEAGRVVSGHRTEASARLSADRIGGCYESADIMAAVQNGMSYTDAVQSFAGRDRRPARVRIDSDRPVAHYAYTDVGACRRDASSRAAQGEDVTVRRYERSSGGFVTLYVPHFSGTGCRIGYASLGEAHDAGERNVHGYAVVEEHQAERERQAERARMGWA